MPKRSAHRKKSVKKEKQNFSWSIFFLVITAIINVYFIYINGVMDYNAMLLPLAAACTSVLTLVLMGSEAKSRLIKKGTILWSVFFAAVTIIFTLAVAKGDGFALLSLAALGSSVIALALLCREKYSN